MHKVCTKSETRSYSRTQKLFIYSLIEFFTFWYHSEIDLITFFSDQYIHKCWYWRGLRAEWYDNEQIEYRSQT